MWVKRCYKPHINHPFGNGNDANYKTGDLVLFFLPTLVASKCTGGFTVPIGVQMHSHMPDILVHVYAQNIEIPVNGYI